MEALARLPLFFALGGRKVVLAGGSEAAAWKLELLAATGARVEVFADEPGDELLRVAAESRHGPVALHRRAWRAADLDGSALAVGAIEDDAEATAFACCARARGVVVNVIDRPAFCDAAFGSLVNRSPLVVGISSDGGAPTLTQAVRVRIEAMLPPGLGPWAAAAQGWRRRIAAAVRDGAVRRRVWQAFARRAFEASHRAPGEADLAALLGEARSPALPGGRGEVVLVGAGPGAPDLLTLKAVRALQSADVILYDNLVGPGVLDYARREAKTMLVGKTGHGPACRQSEINDMMVALARQGRRVVRLKGGDPSVFARAGEEIEACRSAGIPVSVVPGITTATAAAASLGMSLTHRDHAQRLQFVTGHNRAGTLPPDLDLGALADPRATTCLYMGRATVATLAGTLLERGVPPDLPAVCVWNVSRADEHRLHADIGRLAAGAVPEESGPVIVLIGRAVAAAATALAGEAPSSGAAVGFG